LEPIIIILSSSVIAALIAALVSLRTSERKINIENITQERAKWRGAMRELSGSIVKATYAEDFRRVKILCSQLTLNVNPFHKEDQLLIRATELLINSEDKESQIKEFTERMALLLKHDWDRAKRESCPWFFRGEKIRRTSYSDFKTLDLPPKTVKSNKRSLTLLLYFSTLSLSAGIIFFLAVGLSEPFHGLVKIFNDQSIRKPVSLWFQFIFWSLLCGSMWAAAYLWFKGSEKKFLETWYSK